MKYDELTEAQKEFVAQRMSETNQENIYEGWEIWDNPADFFELNEGDICSIIDELNI